MILVDKLNIKLSNKSLEVLSFQLNWINSVQLKLKNNPSVEEIVSVTLNCVLIRMTEINPVDRSVLYQEFKEWILNSGVDNINQEILCIRYLKNNRKTN